MDGESVSCGVDGVIITGDLDRRPSRAPDYEAENRALTALAEEMGANPGAVLQRLVEVAMELTRSDSAGISLLEPGGENGTFRWVATAGAWSPYRDGTMSREASPCGEVIAREAVLLMKNPERSFPALLQAEPGVSEGLLAPFHLGGVPVGTVWTIKHGPGGHFEAEDARVIKSLARFASAAHQTVQALQIAEAASHRAELRVQQLVALAEVSSEFFGTCDMEFMPIYSNAAAMQLVGLADLDEVKRTPLREFFFPEDLPFITDEFFPRVLREGQAKVEIRFRHFVTGEPVWVDYSLVVLKDEMGRATGLGTVTHDLTERKQAEIALQVSEARFRALATVGSSSVYRMSPDWREMRQLDGAAFLAGTDEATTDWVETYIPPDERPRVRDAIHRAIAAKGIFELEHRVLRADGTVGWTCSRAIPLLDDDGEISEWFGTATDVTTRVKADQSFTRLFRAAPAPFLVLKPDAPHFTIAEVNDAYLSATMRTRDEVVGRGVFEAYPDNPSDETVGGVSTLMASLEKVLASGQPDTLPGLKYDVARPDGTFEERWWNPINSAVLDDDGKVEVLIHNANDVTEERRAEAALRESEKKYRTLFETMGQGYALLELVRDASGKAVDQRYLAFNPAIERLLSTSAANAVGKLASEIFPAIEPWWTETFDRVVREGKPERIERFFTPLERWFEVYAYPTGGDGFVTLYEDVTERKRTETALRDSEERQAFLLKLSDALRPLAEPLAVQVEAMRVLGQHLGVNRAQYHELEPNNEWMKPGGGYANGVPLHPSRSRMDDFGAFVRDAYEGARTLVVNDTELDARISAAERAAFAGIGVRAFVAVPLVKNGRFVCLLGLDHATARSWSQAEITLAEEVAERTWAAVERARAEAALRDSEARLAAAFESVPVGAAILDLSGSTVVANAEYRRFLPTGVIPSRDPVRGERWQGWDTEGKLLNPDDFPGARAMRGERVVPGQEMLYADDDGRDIWTRVATVPIRDEDGQVTGQVCVISDIDLLKRGGDALRESEERFRKFSDASTNILWIRDAATLRMQFASPAYDTIYGMPSPDRGGDNRLRSWARLIEPECAKTVLANFRRVRAGERVEQEFRIRRASDGALRWIHSTDFPLHDAAGHVRWVAGLGADMTDAKEAAGRQGILVAELQHRTRNLLAVVRSVARRSIQPSPERDEYDSRLAALGRVQGFLSRSHLYTVLLADLVEAELTAMGDGVSEKVVMGGPAVELPGEGVQAVALALHELATNALKYGALAQDSGLLSVTWYIEDSAGTGADTGAGNGGMGNGGGKIGNGRRLVISWRESGVAMPAGPPARRGYGSELITKALPYQLRAETVLEFTHDGVRCRIALPASAFNIGKET